MRFPLAVIAGLLLFVAAAHAAPTVVSLEFDDGTSDQTQAVEVLDAHHMPGTFYVNSNRIGVSGRFSWSQLAAMQASGHEIAGHTLDHVHLPAVSTTVARGQICADRTVLQAHGIVADDFAYPFGDANSTIEGLVKDCGYASGRLVSGIDTTVSCSGCPYSELLPPRDAYGLRTPDSIRTTTPLSRVETMVERARSHGGGWLQLVMHHICDGCDLYSISRGDLSQLLDWLAGQDEVKVLTVAQALRGTPSPPPPSSGGTAWISNPTAGTARPGTVSIAAGFDLPAGVTAQRVRFLVDGRQLGTRTSAPWKWNWDTTTVAAGLHKLTVIVDGSDGSATTSPAVDFTLAPAENGTRVWVAAPEDATSGMGVTPIWAGYDTSLSVQRVRFYADGVQLGTRIVSPYRWKWDTSRVMLGQHKLAVQVDTTDGNAYRSPSITFTLL